MRKNMKPWSKHKMTDSTKTFEIFANGHTQFLTKAIKRKLFASGMASAHEFNLVGGDVGGHEDRFQHVRDTDEDGGRGRSNEVVQQIAAACSTLSEPYSEFVGGEGGVEHLNTCLITLRLRSLNGRELPELSEGDYITAHYAFKPRDNKAKDDSDDTDSDDDEEGSSHGEQGKRRGSSKRKHTTKKGDGDDDGNEDSSGDEDVESSGSDSDEASSDASGDENGNKRRRRRQKNKMRVKEYVFKVLSIHWGLMPYINLILKGGSSRKGGRSTGGNCHAFAVCELIDSL